MEIKLNRRRTVGLLAASALVMSAVVGLAADSADASTPAPGRYCAAKELGTKRAGYVCAWKGTHRRWQLPAQATTPPARTAAPTVTVRATVTITAPGPTVTVRVTPARVPVVYVGITSACVDALSGGAVLRYRVDRRDGAGRVFDIVQDYGHVQTVLKAATDGSGFFAVTSVSGGEGVRRVSGSLTQTGLNRWRVRYDDGTTRVDSPVAVLTGTCVYGTPNPSSTTTTTTTSASTTMASVTLTTPTTTSRPTTSTATTLRAGA